MMRFMRSGVVVVMVVMLSMGAAPLSMAKPNSNLLDVAGGRIAGAAMADGSTIFYGIPYAESPAGERRWKPPAARAPWGGVLDAGHPAPACVQEDVGWNAGFRDNASEDCLTLSIRAPANSGAKARLPVLVYIHGGSNAAAGVGSMADDALPREGVVLVKIQYRLGVFGFLGLESLSGEDPHHASGNYALLDQLAALRWVKANIGAFGGDAHNITISGNSAGALDALLLTLSPLGKGLFDKAILQAAAPGAPRSALQNEAIGKVLLERLKLPAGADGLAQLRRLPAGVVIQAALHLPTPADVDPSFLWEQQILDGYVMSDSYTDAYNRGAGRGVATIIGSNVQELGADRKPEAGVALIRSAFGARAPAALELYGYRDGKPPPDDPVLGGVPTQVLTDMWFRCPAGWLAERMAAATPRVWRYEFGFGAPGSGKPPEHTSEMFYVYHAVPSNAAADAWPPLQRYWLNFIRNGDPNGPGLPHWPRAGRQAAYLDIGPAGIVAVQGQGLRAGICGLLFKDRDYPSSPVLGD